MTMATNKGRKTCKQCGNTYKMRAFTKNDVVCNVCLAREERQARWLADFECEMLDKWGDLSAAQKAVVDEVLGFGGITPMARAYGVNPGGVYRILDGGDCPKLRKKMGLRKSRRYVVAFHFYDEWTAERLRRLFDAHGKRRDVGQALVTGELRLVEVNDERR